MARDDDDRRDDGEAPRKRGLPVGKKTALALGAAGLFLFILGVKRRYRLDDQRVIDARPPEPDDDDAPDPDDRAR